ncbi:hypothetical protein BD410DRAFT_398337 [Rickenella mellea]|uniref:C2H2-type domain-containing protein n=1 Tax=Rickenella mellea TaxID=50990 RepID=A0A4Y7PXG9_9AGAM|nr:hypothetical protein BD410DRAFT_398337 [Rickenella mellea]
MPGNTNAFKCGAQGCNRSFQTHDALLQHGSNAHAKPQPAPSRVQAQRASNAQPRPTPAPSRVQAPQVRNVFKCGVPGCERSFRSADDLRHHGDDVHRKSNARAAPAKNPYKCGHAGCERSFQTREALVQHGSDSHRSQQAGSSSKSQQNRRASGSSNNASGNPYKCGVPRCNRVYQNFPDLHQHTAASHPKPTAVNTQAVTRSSVERPQYVQIPVPVPYYQPLWTSPAGQPDPPAYIEPLCNPSTSWSSSDNTVLFRHDSPAISRSRADNRSRGEMTRVSEHPVLQPLGEQSDTTRERHAVPESTSPFTPEILRRLSALEANFVGNPVISINTSKLKVFKNLVHILDQRITGSFALGQDAG